MDKESITRCITNAFSSHEVSKMTEQQQQQKQQEKVGKLLSHCVDEQVKLATTEPPFSAWLALQTLLQDQ